MTGKGIPVVAVHPREKAIGTLETFAAIGDVRPTPELAFILVGHRRIEAALDEALAAGVRAFIMPGLGNEAGAEGPAVAARVAERVLSAGGVAVGPNCMGVAVPHGGVVLDRQRAARRSCRAMCPRSSSPGRSAKPSSRSGHASDSDA